MEINETKLSSEKLKDVKDIIAGAFKYEKGNFQRAKYIVERMEERFGKNFACVVGDKYSCGAYFTYHDYYYLRCFFEDKSVVLWKEN